MKMMEKQDYPLTTIVKRAREEHKIDPTISYDFIKNRIQQIYNYPEQIYRNLDSEGINFAVNASSRVDRISLENALIVYQDEPKIHIYIPRRHELVPWVNARNRPFSPEVDISIDEIPSIDEIKRNLTDVQVLRDGRPLQGDYEINGVVYNHRTLPPLQRNHFYLFAESAEFTFHSERYAKQVVRDREGNIGIIKVGDGTLTLENVVMTVDGTNIIKGKWDKSKQKTCDRTEMVYLILGFLSIVSISSGVSSCDQYEIGDKIRGFFQFLLGIPLGLASLGFYIHTRGLEKERDRVELEDSRGMLKIGFYGLVPQKSRDR